METISGIIYALARMMAIAGGIVLAAITVLTVVSVTGRSLVPIGLAPVPGDFELVEAGTAFAVFAFLPWCQLNRGHATVDLFTSYLSAGANRWIDLVAEILMTLTLLVLTWRLAYGMADKLRYGETTFILQFPVWWGFAAAMVGAVVAVIISLYMTAMRVREVATGRTLFTQRHGGGH
ncbi:TRAP transporter small permease subunit [Nitratireductor sp. CAU 1489]|uniref:TRAP transporter small permease protein n=1 Tax=Nitratireductor arenosus TaxID=2682096 RepID=A0A844QHZ1_9HYPH|nr:TRAP transporter small permease subunit [Nitratireductor arenosus]MVA99536.1 TRAP transporter small permease subunit [Nitratireductor arenosus]